MIRIDACWLSAEPLDMRAGANCALTRVVEVFGNAKPHHAYLFVNRRANRLRVNVHRGLGVCSPPIACTRPDSPVREIRDSSIYVCAFNDRT